MDTFLYCLVFEVAITNKPQYMILYEGWYKLRYLFLIKIILSYNTYFIIIWYLRIFFWKFVCVIFQLYRNNKGDFFVGVLYTSEAAIPFISLRFILAQVCTCSISVVCESIGYIPDKHSCGVYIGVTLSVCPYFL